MRHIETLKGVLETILAEYEAETGHQAPKPYDPSNPCQQCYGTGWYGDNGPGIKGNREYIRCECKQIHTSPNAPGAA